MSGRTRAYRRNAGVWLALMTLLAVTTGSAFFDLGLGNTIVNQTIAAAKVIVIGYFFMHLRDAGGLVRLAALLGFFMLGLLLLLGLADYVHRAEDSAVDRARWQTPAVRRDVIDGDPGERIDHQIGRERRLNSPQGRPPADD